MRQSQIWMLFDNPSLTRLKVRPGAGPSTFPLGRFRVNTKLMMKSIRVYTKSNRAPEVGTMVGVRLQEPLLRLLDVWIEKQSVQVTRPEAIRRLTELGLEAAKVSES
jgi:hypothetical protein